MTSCCSWRSNTEFPVRPARMRALAYDRAAKDSESEPWPAAEAHAFELNGEMTPRTVRDLQLLAMRLMDDMQHELLHADFAQGATLSGLRGETAVQNWMADRLRLKQGRAYSVEREPHVVGEEGARCPPARSADRRERAHRDQGRRKLFYSGPRGCTHRPVVRALLAGTGGPPRHSSGGAPEGARARVGRLGQCGSFPDIRTGGAKVAGACNRNRGSGARCGATGNRGCRCLQLCVV